MMDLIRWLLAILFPPKYPTLTESYDDPEEFDEQGEAGPAVPKPYRNGIERHFAEHSQHFSS